MDVAGEYSMYASDITRTLPANGKFTPRQREIYDIVYGAQQAAMQAFKAGESTRASLKQVAMDYINAHGKDLHGQPLGQYFIHGLSHNIGLNVHDPGPDIPIQPGMVFSNEPGIYIPEESLGVRIEDVMWINPEGKMINLSAAAPSTADDIERMMAQRGATKAAAGK
jgi:Xaa-Pro aminopeptidase